MENRSPGECSDLPDRCAVTRVLCRSSGEFLGIAVLVLSFEGGQAVLTRCRGLEPLRRTAIWCPSYERGGGSVWPRAARGTGAGRSGSGAGVQPLHQPLQIQLAAANQHAAQLQRQLQLNQNQQQTPPDPSDPKAAESLAALVELAKALRLITPLVAAAA